MSIPKLIHCGVFGGYQLSEMERKCRETWASALPDYEIINWDDFDGPRDINFFARACVERPVNASNYIRFWALHKYGGIFLDNDVEVIKPFDLDQECFLAFQRDDTIEDCINTAVIGSVPGDSFIRTCMNRIEGGNPDIWPVWPACTVPLEELTKMGLDGLNREQKVGDVMVYSKDRFYPWRWDEPANESAVTDRTFAVHRFGGSWNK